MIRRVPFLALVAFVACGGQESSAPAPEAFDLEAYTAKAKEHLRTLTSTNHSSWRQGEAERWDADQKTGLIKWTFADGATVSAPYQIVGTYDSVAGTFQWGWDHPSVAVPLREDAAAVLAFAREHGIERLQTRTLECTEEEAWELTALATLIADRQGAYRGPVDTVFVFMTFGEVTVTAKP